MTHDPALEFLREDARRLGLTEREYARRFGLDPTLRLGSEIGPSRDAETPEVPMSEGVDNASPIAWGSGCDHPQVIQEEWRPGFPRPFCVVCETFVTQRKAPTVVGADELREAA